MTVQLELDLFPVQRTPPSRKGLCPSHEAASLKWLDWIGTPGCRSYSVGPMRLIQIGAPNERNIAWNLRDRAGRVYALVREQQAGIADLCAQGVGCGDRP